VSLIAVSLSILGTQNVVCICRFIHVMVRVSCLHRI